MKIINIEVTDKIKLLGIDEGGNLQNANFPLKFAEGNYKSIIMNFTFKSNTWTGLRKYATFFINGKDNIQVEISNIEDYSYACYIPYAVFQKKCNVSMGLYGIANNEEKLQKVISTELIKIFIVEGAYSESIRQGVETPTNTEVLQSKIFENKQSINNLIENKVDKVENKGLSTNDYTDEDKAKLKQISEAFEDFNDYSNNSKLKSYTTTLTSTNWVLNETTNLYEYTITNENITVNHRVTIDADIENKQKFTGIGDVKSFAEGFKITSTEVPEDDIEVTVTYQLAAGESVTPESGGEDNVR